MIENNPSGLAGLQCQSFITKIGRGEFPFYVITPAISSTAAWAGASPW
jgi:hypothetical protein